jgi:hypothetical protein
MVRRLLVVSALVVAFAGLTGVAAAYWQGGGAGSGTAITGTLSAPGQPGATPSGGSYTLAWPAGSVSGAGAVAYHVERRDEAGATWESVCASTHTSPISVESCSVDPAAASVYRVTSRFGSWSAVGPESEPVHPLGDTTAPAVLQVDSPLTDGTYRAGQLVPVTVRFSEPVEVTGTPRLTLATGATQRPAGYASGSGTDTLTFEYTVQDGDNAGDLDYAATGSLSPNGGAIRDAAGNGAALTLPAPGAAGSLGANRAIVVDTAAPAAPTAVTLASGGGCVNLATRAAVAIEVAVPATSSGADTIRVTVTDSNGSVLIFTRPAINGGGTVSFSGLDLTGLAEGVLTLRGYAGDVAGNSSSPLINTYTKDTVVPGAPASVALTNGLGAGNSYINRSNRGAVSFQVTWSPDAANSAGDTISVALTTSGGPASATGSGPRGAGASLAVTGLDAAAVEDGTVTATAKATDAAGNSSGTVTATMPKDTVVATITDVTLANGAGQGNAYVNAATRTAVDFEVHSTSGSATDTITLAFASSGGGTVPARSGARGASSRTAFGAVNASALNDGVITATATASDTAGNTSSAANAASIVKDVVAPAIPNAPALANGGGAGSAYVNRANRGALSFTVPYTADPANSASDTIVVAVTGGASASAGGTRNGTSPATVSGLDATALSDGTVTAVAAARDLAGNQSGYSAATTITKDTAAPSTLTSVAPVNYTNILYGFTVNNIDHAVSWPAAGSAATDQVTLTMASSAGGATVTRTVARGATSPVRIDNVDPTTVPDGTITLSAVITDAAGNTSAAVTQTATVLKDVVRPTATSLTLSNRAGGTAGLIEAGDRMVIGFSEELRAATICGTWTGTTPSLTNATVTVGNLGTNDYVTLAIPSGCGGVFNPGALLLGGDYVSANKTFTNSTVAWDGATATLTVTLGTLTASAGTLNVVASSTATFYPDADLRDLPGNGPTGTQATGAVQNF